MVSSIDGDLAGGHEDIGEPVVRVAAEQLCLCSFPVPEEETSEKLVKNQWGGRVRDPGTPKQ